MHLSNRLRRWEPLNRMITTMCEKSERARLKNLQKVPRLQDYDRKALRLIADTVYPLSLDGLGFVFGR